MELEWQPIWLEFGAGDDDVVQVNVTLANEARGSVAQECVAHTHVVCENVGHDYEAHDDEAVDDEVHDYVVQEYAENVLHDRVAHVVVLVVNVAHARVHELVDVVVPNQMFARHFGNHLDR